MKLSFCVSALFLLLFLTCENLACSCDIVAGYDKSEQQKVEEDRKNAHAVFSGKVTKIVLSDAPKGQEPYYAKVYFEVIKSWKGIITEETIVQTENICCLCGFP